MCPIHSNRRKTGSVRIGGIVNRAPHPKNPKQPLAGGPQMVEVSRDGKRIYFRLALRRVGRTILSRTAWAVGWSPTLRRGPGRRHLPRSKRKRFIWSTSSAHLGSVQIHASEGGDSSSDSYCFREGGPGLSAVFGLGASFHGIKSGRWMVVCCWTRNCRNRALARYPSRCVPPESLSATPLSIGIIHQLPEPIFSRDLARVYRCHHSL